MRKLHFFHCPTNPYKIPMRTISVYFQIILVDCNEEGGMEEVLVLGCDTKN